MNTAILQLARCAQTAAANALKALWSRRSPLGLLGGLIDVNTGAWRNLQSGIGAGADSFYEYLLKLYVLTGEQDYWRMWADAREAMRVHMQSRDGWFLNVHMANGHVTNHYVDALMAFFPAALVQAGDLDAAARLHTNFHRLWRRYGLLPEHFNIQQVTWHPHLPRGYPLRPELIESTYVLYRATGDQLYLHAGKELMRDLNKYTRVPVRMCTR